MAVYGLQVFDSSGREVVNVSDNLGRIIGYFNVPALAKKQRRVDTFNAPASALNYGKLFVWCNPSDYTASTGNAPYAESKSTITISGTKITIDHYSEDGRPAFKLWYGVV